MEKIEFQNRRGKILKGILYPAPSKSSIIMAHGFTSDKYSRGRFPLLAEAFNKSGFNVLTFDFSGCGESDDDSINAEKEVEDLQSAINYAKSKGFRKIGLYGHSLGSLVCLKAYSGDIETMVLSGAGTGPMHYNWDEFFTMEQMNELAETSLITEKRNEPYRSEVVIEKQMLDDFASVNQEELLSKVKCPVLIIHGDNKNDEEELMLLENSKKGMDYLPTSSRLEVISGATHSFMGHLDELKALADTWYQKYLPKV
ncbi:alpha/beta hydrolase [Pseudalkalibacillus caeni]|uniref:Alpha/beta hydrolase n=1 Tax=Exobacillus caeni TaxID=2574798 RepID=A0A5R9F3D0_9BACL|nr:alpha/beta hydrolase [Pseudalkalibacillus caeni]TLS36846.1 alpha/beta hydrolase [Pseudalkalibacillus caeni]